MIVLLSTNFGINIILQMCTDSKETIQQVPKMISVTKIFISYLIIFLALRESDCFIKEYCIFVINKTNVIEFYDRNKLLIRYL